MWRKIIVAFVALAAGTQLPSSTPASHEKQPDLVHNDGRSLVYCLPGTLVTQGQGTERVDPWPMVWWQLGQRLHRPGLTLMHVSLQTGRAKVLRTTGHKVTAYRDNTAAQRLHWTDVDTRLLGMIAKQGHLYVGVSTAAKVGRSPVRHTYSVAVYDLESGRQIGEAIMNAGPEGGPKANVPAAPPPESAKQGPLKERREGISLFGATFEIQEGKLKWADAIPSTQPVTSRKTAAGR